MANFSTNLIFFFSLFLLAAIDRSLSGPCGGYRDGVTSGQSFRLTSPNYPDAYPRNQRCVWLFTATAGTGFVVNVSGVSLEGAGNSPEGCKDYLQITDGSSRANQLAYLCRVTNPMQVVGNRLYLWINFQSDHQNQGSGFDVTVHSVANSNATGGSSPIISCNITRYTCPNKECIYHGSICDSVNDCGCDDYGCDETKCWKFEALNNLAVVWGIGSGVGIAIVLVAFIACGFIEMPERKRPECLRRRPEMPECFARCAKRNQVKQQTAEDSFMAMMKRMTGGNTLRWDAAETESETSRSGGPSRSVSRRTSISGSDSGSASVSRRSSAYNAALGPPVYGHTLSPKDSLKVAAASAKALQPPRSGVGASTLAVPKVSTA